MANMNISENWRNVDRDPAAADRYLRIAGEALAAIRVRTSDRLHLSAGTRVLEVGCGNGMEAERMAALVGPTGSVTAVDVSVQLIAAAQERTRSLGLPLDFRTADAHALPFPDGHFDAARIERVLQHLVDPQRAVDELVRVVRPGGYVCVLEPDWQAVIVTGGDIEVERAVSRFKAERDVTNGTIGRDLPELLRSAGCVDIAVESAVTDTRDLAFADLMVGLSRCLQGAVDEGWISPVAAEEWWSAVQARARQGTFYGAGMLVVASGRMP